LRRVYDEAQRRRLILEDRHAEAGRNHQQRRSLALIHQLAPLVEGRLPNLEQLFQWAALKRVPEEA